MTFFLSLAVFADPRRRPLETGHRYLPPIARRHPGRRQRRVPGPHYRSEFTQRLKNGVQSRGTIDRGFGERSIEDYEEGVVVHGCAVVAEEDIGGFDLLIFAAGWLNVGLWNFWTCTFPWHLGVDQTLRTLGIAQCNRLLIIIASVSIDSLD